MTEPKTKQVKLSKHEWRVLRALRNLANDEYSDEWYCFPFRTIAKDAHMRRNDVRLACRSLARKGLAQYERGLVSMQTDEFAGAGYRATQAGFDLFTENETNVPAEPMI
jgi:RIO-like serine/threonine protein kinase